MYVFFYVHIVNDVMRAFVTKRTVPELDIDQFSVSSAHGNKLFGLAWLICSEQE